jgi:hypothetical protein
VFPAWLGAVTRVVAAGELVAVVALDGQHVSFPIWRTAVPPPLEFPRLSLPRGLSSSHDGSCRRCQSSGHVPSSECSTAPQ